jgi:hypothetical protein
VRQIPKKAIRKVHSPSEKTISLYSKSDELLLMSINFQVIRLCLMFGFE